MKSQRLLYSLTIAFALFSQSCGDDPALVEKREKQKAEIARLRGELAMIDEKLKNLPPDVSTELAGAELLHEKHTAELASLESEITTLEARKRSLTAEYDAYKIKYSVK